MGKVILCRRNIISSCNISAELSEYELSPICTMHYRKDMDDSGHSGAEMISMERSTHSSSSSSYQPPNSSADSDVAGWRGAMGMMVGLVQEAPRFMLSCLITFHD